ncbi:Phosphate acyltransferase [bacterium HR13]|uniref:Phosphate acyltransferase n=1 Tax=uncultured Aquificia bacterium TaxID=453415 RepID=H5SDT5_9BACT|nr:glycerol-3-phosphate acyltransferase PlsX [uncultured Aquificae bacterium]GBC89207.1 Phosphate acyltransferase [bacterium HR13]
MNRPKIAVDCMGGDYAPEEIVKGCLLACRELEVLLYLVGDEKRIRNILEREGACDKERLVIVHADDVVGMHEPASNVLKKKNSSLYVAGLLLRENKADGLVSAGNTGAVLTVGKFLVGALEEIERPAIGVALPNPKGRTVLIDVGANVDCKPKHLLQFAIIGHTYAKEILGIQNPRVGILSIGEEEGKGNELVRESYSLLKRSKLNFLGNAEGRDIYAGTFDVIVCDGFVGNVILKASESLGMAVLQMIKEEVQKSLLAKIGALLIKPALNNFKKKADFAEYGGIPLLGAKKPVIITHGRANAKAIKNAIRVANEFYLHHFNERLSEDIKNLSPKEVRI